MGMMTYLAPITPAELLSAVAEAEGCTASEGWFPKGAALGWRKPPSAEPTLSREPVIPHFRRHPAPQRLRHMLTQR